MGLIKFFIDLIMGVFGLVIGLVGGLIGLVFGVVGAGIGLVVLIGGPAAAGAAGINCFSNYLLDLAEPRILSGTPAG